MWRMLAAHRTAVSQSVEHFTMSCDRVASQTAVIHMPECAHIACFIQTNL